MEKKILLSDIADLLSDKANITKKSADNFVRLFFSTIEDNLLADRYVKIKNFGSFKLVNVSERESVNVATGERFQISSHSKVTFTAEGMLRDQVNLPFAHFSSMEISDDVDINILEAAERADKATSAKAPTTEEITAEEPVAEEPVAEEPTAEEPANEQPIAEEPATEEPATEEPTADVAQDATEQIEAEVKIEAEVNSEAEEEASEPAPTNWWKVAFISMIVAMLIVASYFAGYYRIFSSQPTESAPVEKCATATKSDDKPQPTTKSKPTTETKKATSPHEAEPDNSIPQIPDGEYKIIGTRTVHEFKTGESLRSLSLKYYGNIDMVKYIVIHNDIKNPDVIALNAKIAIPEVVRK